MATESGSILEDSQGDGDGFGLRKTTSWRCVCACVWESVRSGGIHRWHSSGRVHFFWGGARSLRKPQELTVRAFLALGLQAGVTEITSLDFCLSYLTSGDGRFSKHALLPTEPFPTSSFYFLQ